VSAEESVDQVAARAERLGLGGAGGVMLASLTRVEDILAAAASLRPAALVVDSIQTVYLDGAAGSAGSVAQVRECATAFVRAAKDSTVPTFLIGHVTKSGDVAGPQVLQHVVDTVLYLEGDRGSGGDLRVLRAVKNRYGATDEVGVFRMADSGLAAVPDPSAALLAERAAAPAVAAGVTVAVEGSRPLLVEVQALVAPSAAAAAGAGPPLRSPGGVRRDRLALILAVLAKHAKLRLGRADVHCNVVGGVDAREPAADLAIAAALAASALDAPGRRDAVAIGEVGLGGELRSVPRAGARLAEAAKLGFARAVIPASQTLPPNLKLGGMTLVRAKTLAEALPALVDVPAGRRRRRAAAEESEDGEAVF
jgi:DNA repair protein RadA/Sms